MTGDPKMSTAAVISRLVDGEGSPADWQAFRALAESDPTLWRELAEFQQDHAELAAYVNRAVAIADTVEVDVQGEMHRRFAERMRVVATWGGWAAAAAIVLAWTTAIHAPAQQSSPVTTSSLGVNLPQPAPQSASDAFNDYIEKGKQSGLVVGEVPNRVLVEARPMKAGGYEVIYLHQVLERRTVRELSTLATDEFGTPVPIPIAPASTPAQPAPSSGAGPY